MVYQQRSAGAVPHLVAGVDAIQRRLGEELGERLEAERLALRGSHGRLLSIIGAQGTRPSVLAAGWISRQAVGQRIGELSELGLVEVRPDPHDRRATVVHRTARGDEVLSQLVEVIADIERQMRQEVGAERYEAFRAVLDELAGDHLPPALLGLGPSTG